MKTLILYATKHGAAAEIARRIADRIDGAEIHDLKQSSVPSLDGFDCVIIGGSLYAGMIRKEAKAFAAHNAAALCEKKLGLFLSGFSEKEEKKSFQGNFPPEVLNATKMVSILGGIFDPKKAGFFERLVMKAVTKQSGYISTIDDDKIAKFVETLQA